MSAPPPAGAPKMPQKSPVPAGNPAAARPATASPKKMLGSKSAVGAAPPQAGGAKSPVSLGMKKAPSPTASGTKSPSGAPIKSAPPKRLVPSASTTIPPAATAAGGVAPAASAAPASPGKKMFKRPVSAAGATAAGVAPPAAPTASKSPPPQTNLPQSASQAAAPADAEAKPTPVDSSLLVAPPPPGTTIQHPPLDVVISRNQEAAAALAILVSKQTEADREKLAVATEKIEALQKLLVEREGENKSKIDSLEKQLAVLATAHASTRRENELLKDVLADRDGPKMVQRLELLEEENSKLKAAVAKFKTMAEYHRGQQLKAMEDVEKLQEGKPIGPTQTEWEGAQDSIAFLNKENATLTMRLGELEEMLTAAEDRKKALLDEQRQQIELLKMQQEQYKLEQQLAHQQSMAAIAAADPRLLASSSKQEQEAHYGGAPPPHQTYASYLSQTHRDMYKNLNLSSHPKSSMASDHNPYTSSANFYSAASPSPHVNNSKFTGFSGSPLRGTVSPASTAAAGAGGTRGWRALMLPNGNVIYHNTISNRSQWEVPAELAYNMSDVTDGVEIRNSAAAMAAPSSTSPMRYQPPFSQYKNSSVSRGFL